jgi:hypothetical protein
MSLRAFSVNLGNTSFLFLKWNGGTLYYCF